MLTLLDKDPVAVALVAAIRAGDIPSLERLIEEHAGLASAAIQGCKGGARFPLHVATDWPGHFPNVAASIRALIRAGADPNVRTPGPGFAETPLHWAASSDDVDALDALIDGGADIELDRASIADGTALDNAVGYGQYNVARRLVERGARTKLWHAAALGMMSRVQEYFEGATRPTPDEITEAFWQACNGGQRATAEFLLAHGADLNWIPDWSPATPLDIAEKTNPLAEDLVEWLRGLGAKSADEI